MKRKAAFLATAFLLAGCGEKSSGPIAVSAIGEPPQLANPSREQLDPASAYLVESAAQGLVRFDAAGEIEPALAQSWVISDDGLRYTFRIARDARWSNGERVTSEQVVARLRAAAAPSSRNPLRPLLGAIDEIVRMTDDVLEIDLKAPRPNFLQLLAQPELGLVRGRIGSGPLRPVAQRDGSILLSPPPPEDEDEAPRQPPSIVLRGESAAAAVARFDQGEAELVLGGRLGDLPLARAAEPAATTLQFDPVDGLLGLAFAPSEGPLGMAEVRQALAMAIDRAGLVQLLGVRRLAPRETLLPPGVEGLTPAAPAWSALDLSGRREQARRILAGRRLAIRVAIPDEPGYRLLFAWLRRDWATIGVAAERVAPGAAADLVLVDEVAPAALASWYLRHFTCAAGRLCVGTADAAMDQARMAPNAAARRPLLAQADRALTDAALFVPLTAPVRWSMAAARLSGFKPNAFGRHPAGELIATGP